MKISIVVFGRIYSICIGYKTPFFSQKWFISIAREWREENMEVSYAELIFHS